MPVVTFRGCFASGWQKTPRTACALERITDASCFIGRPTASHYVLRLLARWSPPGDGARIASGGFGLEQRSRSPRLVGHAGPLLSINFSHDGKRIAQVARIDRLASGTASPGRKSGSFPDPGQRPRGDSVWGTHGVHQVAFGPKAKGSWSSRTSRSRFAFLTRRRASRTTKSEPGYRPTHAQCQPFLRFATWTMAADQHQLDDPLFVRISNLETGQEVRRFACRRRSDPVFFLGRSLAVGRSIDPARVYGTRERASSYAALARRTDALPVPSSSVREYGRDARRRRRLRFWNPARPRGPKLGLAAWRERQIRNLEQRPFPGCGQELVW